jgi:phosphoribosylaminoimidazole carboxylase PurE protein
MVQPGGTTKPVLIVVGAESDKERIVAAFQVLDEAKVGYVFEVSSAHRQAEATAKLAKEAKKNGHKVIIAAAGLAAALPGTIAALTELPVIGLPLDVGPRCWR